MRIAILNKYQRKVYRGAEAFVYELGKRLSKNHQVDIISEVNYFDLLKGHYDIIVPTNGRFQVVIVRIISWLSGARMVVSGHSGIGWDDRVNLYALPDTFVALTKKAESWAKKINPFVKVVHIPNGVDLDKFNSNNNFDNNLRRPCKDRPYKVVLAVGAFTEQKRMNLVIDAVAKLTNVKLIIAGGGGDKRQDIIDYGLKVLGQDRFKVVTVPFEKMPELYRAADVFTFSSWSSESFGNVLIEAMATNLPVVATDDSIRREIVGDAGILVDPTDTEAFAKAIKTALGKNWGDIPRTQAEKFSWEIIAEKYDNLFKEITK